MKQLDLIDGLYVQERREARFLDELFSHIKNTRYIKNQVELSFPCEEAVQMLERSLYWMAALGFQVSRHLPEYKDKDSEFFVDMTKNKVILGLSEPRTPEEMYECSIKQEGRFRTLVLAYKDVCAKYYNHNDTIKQSLKNTSKALFDLC